MSRRRTDKIAYWILAVILAMAFLQSGLPKIDPDPGMVERFEAWGYSAGFCRVIGVLEVLGGLLVLVPAVAFYGAAVLAVVMAGAIWTHLASGIGSWTFAAQYLLLAVAYGLLRLRDRRPGRH